MNNVTEEEAWHDDRSGQSRAYLQQFLQENSTQLQAIICSYVAKMGLATGDTIAVVAAEVFQDATVETLAHADRFQPSMQPRAWFLAIAANILKRHRTRLIKRYRFEVTIGSLLNQSEGKNEQDVLDKLMARSTPGPEHEVEIDESVRELLALVSAEDARLLELALLNEWNATTLGAIMRVSPGTARVRVHRAVERLRKAWQRQQSTQRKEQHKQDE